MSKKETLEKTARTYPVKGDKLVYSSEDYLIYFKEWDKEKSPPMRWVPIDLALIGLDRLPEALGDFEDIKEAVEIVDTLIKQLRIVKGELLKKDLSKIQIVKNANIIRPR